MQIGKRELSTLSRPSSARACSWLRKLDPFEGNVASLKKVADGVSLGRATFPIKTDSWSKFHNRSFDQRGAQPYSKLPNDKTETTAAGHLRPPPGRRRDRLAAGQVRPGRRLLVGQQALHRAAVHDVAAVLAGARADVDDPVGGADGVLVVLDHDQRVAQVLQPDQRLDQPVVVPLVQADGRLVQHVEHADQAGADLGGQPDALRLAAGEGAGAAVQRQVVQARRRPGTAAGR